MLPLLDLHAQHASLGRELEDAFAQVLAHGKYVNGPEVAEFEEAFADYCGATHCIGAANGTEAIGLVLRAAGVRAGDEVITTAMTFIATVEPLLLLGAVPVLADPDPETGLLTVETVEALITPRTAALLPVHLYGQPVDLDAFRSLADRHGLLLIEDAAQAHGARWADLRVGSVGNAATFSFFPGKNLGALGDAGAVTTNDGQLAERIRKLRDHGRVDKYRHDEIGTNARLDTLQAALLSVKLRRLDEWNEGRRRVAAMYDAAFAGVEGVEPIRVDPRAHAVYHQYVVRVKERDAVQASLADAGIATGVHYPIPLHRQPALAGTIDGEFAAADELAAEVLSIPVYPELADDQVESIVAAVSAAVRPAAGIAR